MTPHEHVVSEIAELVTKRVVRRATRKVQELRDGMQLGEDTGLLNIWDEVCVQVQTERTLVWWAYEKTIRSILHGELQRVPAQELKAIWLEMALGADWAQEEGVDESPSYCLDDVEDHVYDALMTNAVNYSNERIRSFMYR
jgi:hypothetical protein